MPFNTEHPHPPGKPSRLCHVCERYWPNEQGWTSCPLCDAPTQGSEYDPDWATPALAYAFVLTEKRRRERQERIDEFDAAADAAALEADLTQMLFLDEAELAAQFAKLTESTDQGGG